MSHMTEDRFMHLLIVEGKQEVRRHLITLCRQAGDTADAVTTAAEALHAIAARTYDLAIISLRLPDGDGVAVLRRLHARGGAMPMAICGGLLAGELRTAKFDDASEAMPERLSSYGELLTRLRLLGHARGAGGARAPVQSAGSVCASRDAAAG